MLKFISAVTMCAGLLTTIGNAQTLAKKTGNKNTVAKSGVSARLAITITGTVRDASTNAGIASASVTVGSTGAILGAGTTDDSGHYSITVQKAVRGKQEQLLVRRIGYKSYSVQIKLNADTITVDTALEATAMMLGEVTVAATMPQRESVRSTFATSMVSANGIAGTSPAVTSNAGPLSRAEVRAQQKRKTEASERARDDRFGGAGLSREQYDRIEDNPFLVAKNNARSTFSIDVDRASYANVRRFLNSGQTPPADAVRIEELINYFPYQLEEPRGEDPIAITTEVAPTPWQTQHQLVRIALQARRVDLKNLPPNNLVFLVDVSGSMSAQDKLPLVKESLRLLVDQLRAEDRVALVVYAGNAGLVLPSTSGANKDLIQRAIERLEAGGSTAGGEGIKLAYSVARENFLAKGNNRVILATDGDFNVGASSDSEMERLIEEKRAEGTYLTVLGFGRGDTQDAKMEKLAKKGNGNYAYVDNLDEARKTLVREMGATLLTVANDVKLQVEFNPSSVQAYRLIGYEDRLLRNEDFVDDKKDAGDIGSGHTVTALYEIVPVGVKGTVKVLEEDGLRYVTNTKKSTPKAGSELMFVKLRYKTPGDSRSKLITHAIQLERADRATSDDFRFAASVASFGMLLRGSEYKGNATSYDVLTMARESVGEDAGSYRAEFVRLVERWQNLKRVAADRH